jgi:antirestriction protein
MTHELATIRTESLAEAASIAEVGAEAEPQLRPQIWLASLTDHEWGVKHGAWVSANQEVSGIRADLECMLARSPIARRNGQPVSAWAIFYSADFGSYQVRQHDSLHLLSLIGRGLAQHGAPFAAWANLVHDPDQLADFDTAYLGQYDSLHAYIEQLVNDLGYHRILDEDLPAGIRPYVKIDIAATADDLMRGGDLHALPASDSGVWIFR